MFEKIRLLKLKHLVIHLSEVVVALSHLLSNKCTVLRALVNKVCLISVIKLALIQRKPWLAERNLHLNLVALFAVNLPFISGGLPLVAATLPRLLFYKRAILFFQPLPQSLVLKLSSIDLLVLRHFLSIVNLKLGRFPLWQAGRRIVLSDLSLLWLLV